MTEMWKAIPGYEGLYEVSSHGRIRSLDREASSRGQCRRERLLKPNSTNTGYQAVSLWADRKRKRYLIHRLVLEAFIGPCPAGMEACHNDGDRRNNAVANLRWDSRVANHADKVRHGTSFSRDNHPLAKLSSGDVRHAAELRASGATYQAIADRFGVSRRAISMALRELAGDGT